jgi:hypothetical protein
MMRRSQFRVCGWIVGFGILVMLLAACGSRDKYAGVYEARPKGFPNQGTVVLELRTNGDGLWKVRSGEAKAGFVEVPITWNIKRGDLRINTKAGGVMVGKIRKDTIQITMPGAKTLIFRKTQ